MVVKTAFVVSTLASFFSPATTVLAFAPTPSSSSSGRVSSSSSSSSGRVLSSSLHANAFDGFNFKNPFTSSPFAPAASVRNGDKVTVIAGATGYIGKSTVRESVRQGYRTVALVRDKKKVESDEG
jgi:hypothetical protein